jgi:hypothetical protein
MLRCADVRCQIQGRSIHRICSQSPNLRTIQRPSPFCLIESEMVERDTDAILRGIDGESAYVAADATVLMNGSGQRLAADSLPKLFQSSVPSTQPNSAILTNPTKLRAEQRFAASNGLRHVPVKLTVLTVRHLRRLFRDIFLQRHRMVHLQLRHSSTVPRRGVELSAFPQRFSHIPKTVAHSPTILIAWHTLPSC